MCTLQKNWDSVNVYPNSNFQVLKLRKKEILRTLIDMQNQTDVAYGRELPLLVQRITEL